MATKGRKWLAASALSLAGAFGFAALYCPKVEITGEMDGARISQNNHIMAMELHTAAGRSVNFDVSRLHLTTDNTVFSAYAQYKATSNESLLRTLWLAGPHPSNAFKDADYVANTLEVTPPRPE